MRKRWPKLDKDLLIAHNDLLPKPYIVQLAVKFRLIRSIYYECCGVDGLKLLWQSRQKHVGSYAGYAGRRTCFFEQNISP